MIHNATKNDEPFLQVLTHRCIHTCEEAPVNEHM